MEACGALQAMQFTQHLLIAIVVHVSIGIYGSYYILLSLSGISRFPNARGGDVQIPRRISVWDRDERTKGREHFTVIERQLPESARQMSLWGLVVFGFFGIFGIPVLLIMVVLGRQNLAVRRWLVSLASSGPDWHNVSENVKTKYYVKEAKKNMLDEGS